MCTSPKPDSNSDTRIVLQDLKDRMAEFIRHRDWERYHTPKNISMSIAIEAAELMEIFQWLTPEESIALKEDPAQYRHIQEEISDILLYCFSLANVLDIDIGSAVLGKLESNKKKYPAEQFKGNYFASE